MDKILSVDNITLNVDVNNWEEAVVAAGTILEKNGYVTSDYIDGMVEAVKVLGPYIVIAPGLAMPHSKKGGNILKSGISLITLKNAIRFGNKANDPVQMVIGLAGVGDDLHVDILQAIATVFEDEQMLESMVSWNDKEKIAEVFNNVEVD